jgi:hypothetical protein
MEAAMFHFLRPGFDRADWWDLLSGLAALAYILGFVVAIEVALGKLIY